MTRADATIDRRALITGRVVDTDRVVAPPEGEIASVLVQVRPEHLGEVAASIADLNSCEVHDRDPQGKLVVVIDTPKAGVIGTTLNTIAQLPNVYSASLVFHALDVA